MATCCEIKGATVPVKIWSPLESVESAALTQLRNIASLPWVFHHVAAMADVHLGIGATVGSVIATRNAISPAAVGVDIGCGCAAVKTSLFASNLPDSLRGLRSDIEAAIPVGPNGHTDLAWRKIPGLVDQSEFLMGYTFSTLSPLVQTLHSKAGHQLGTLGGGNHFIELCVADDESVWLMLHSGSRNIGKCLAEIHIAKAQALAHNDHLVDRDLAAFLADTPEMDAYWNDLCWAQEYARLNRLIMLNIYIECIEKFFGKPGYHIIFDTPITCHHNYVSSELHFGEAVFVTRKGAISARAGQLGIIPGSMGTASYIVRGLGNPESFCSASHGAGRKMSRGAAKRSFSVADLELQTAGVECRKDAGVLDEIPGAYKDIDAVMSNQDDLVKVVFRLKQVMCVKG
jgi:tRNA-splicing ligase RtcB (3'-phosphate/5'-hydroxy nucleic acid ligase)